MPSRPPSRFDVRPLGDGRFDIAGELDLSTAPRLEEALAGEPSPAITLEVSGLRFLDSSGLRVLLKAVVTGRSLTLRAPTPTVERTLRMAGVDRLPGLTIEG